MGAADFPQEAHPEMSFRTLQAINAVQAEEVPPELSQQPGEACSTPRMVSFGTQQKIAEQESKQEYEEKRVVCFVHGERTDNPLYLPKERGCPHAACTLECLNKLAVQWVDIQKELRDMDSELSAL